MLTPGTVVHTGMSTRGFPSDRPSADVCLEQVSGAVRRSLSASASCLGSLLNSVSRGRAIPVWQPHAGFKYPVRISDFR